MRLSIREAFDLTVTQKVVIGGTDYHVPPLTFGRLDQLLGAQKHADLSALAAFKFGDVGTPEEVGRALAHFPIEEFAGAAAAVVPGLTMDEWKANGDPFVFLSVLSFLAKTHDWPYIGEHLFGKPESSDAADVTMGTALVLLARALGCQITELLEFRAEGFFSCVDAMKEKRALDESAAERQESEADGWERHDPADVVPFAKDASRSSVLDALVSDAEKRAQGGAASV